MAPGPIEGLAGVLIWTEADRFPAMARFYRDTLGLAPRSAKPDFINFDWSGVRLSVGVHDRVRGVSRESLRIMINLTVGDIRADRKSTRLNSSHGYISYAVFCLKKKKKEYTRC